MKKLMFLALLTAITLLVATSSCTKEKMEASVKTSVLAEPSINSIGSSGEESALLLAKNSGFPNTTYYSGTNQKIGDYVARNTFPNPVKIQTAEVSFFSTSSTEGIPLQGIKNLAIYINGAQVGPTVGQPLVDGRVNLVTINQTVQPNMMSNLLVLSDLQNPPFAFFSKLKLKGIDLVTGQQVSTVLAIGQTINVVPEPVIIPTFVPSLSSVSQYVACGNVGNEYLTNAVFHFPANSMGYRIVGLSYSIVQQNSSVNAVKVGHVNGPSFIVAPFVAGIATINSIDVINKNIRRFCAINIL